MGDIQIIGFSDSDKVPGFYGNTLFGQSAIQIGTITRKVLVCGLKGSAGDIAEDGEKRRIQTEDDANAAFGIGTEGARMCYAALAEARGLGNYELWACCPAASGSAAAATMTMTITGTATAVGVIGVSIGGDYVEVVVASGDDETDAATKVSAEIAKFPKVPATSSPAAGVITLTHKTPGIRGNDCVVYVDFSKAPGLSVALSGTGGAAATSSATLVGRTFGSGAGTETLTNILAFLFAERFDFCAFAQNDATSLAAIKAQCDLKAGPTEGRMEHYLTASNGNFAAATSLAQTTLNNWRFRLDHLALSERAPSELAAAQAALRAAIEGANPNSAYDDYELRWAVPQRFSSDWVASHTAKQAALDVGVTPYETRANGKVYIVRSITTRSLDGTTPDYRTLDTYASFVPDYVRDRLRIVWTSSYKPANPYVQPEPAAGEDAPAGVAYPSGWNSRITQELRAMESERVLTQVSANLPKTEYNYVANRLMSAVPSVPTPHQHQVGVQVSQLNVTA